MKPKQWCKYLIEHQGEQLEAWCLGKTFGNGVLVLDLNEAKVIKKVDELTIAQRQAA